MLKIWWIWKFEIWSEELIDGHHGRVHLIWQGEGGMKILKLEVEILAAPLAS